MADFIAVIATFAFFLVAVLYTNGCEQLNPKAGRP